LVRISVRRASFRVVKNCFIDVAAATTFFTSTGSKKPRCIAKRIETCSSIGSGLKAGCLNSSTMREPRSSCALVLASRSEPNCATAASSI